MPSTRRFVMRRWLFLSLILILALSVVAVSCGSGSTTTTTGGATTTAGGATTTAGGATTTAGGTGGAQVTIKDFAFSPTSVTVKVGDTVTWTNQDSAIHTVAADNGEFSSDNLAKGAAFSFTFTKAGSYPYHCSVHPTMKATVVVQ